MNDEQIIQLFFTRNEDAIRQTDDRYGAKLTRLSENIVGSREDAVPAGGLVLRNQQVYVKGVGHHSAHEADPLFCLSRKNLPPPCL